MSNQWNPESVFEILADGQARRILALTSISPQSAEDLVDICDGSDSAVYRRLQVLEENGFLSEQLEICPHGCNYREYSTDLSALEIEYRDVGLRLDTGEQEHIERWVDPDLVETG